MEFTSDQIAAIIGAKELELISLRFELQQALAELKKLRETAAAPNDAG
jgi:hypothetical protein